ncbi:MAG: hypothetical protein HC882_02025 [Acidobacteria bacterium]|nr:hypothetical protein [Acidobacteriota bacterium]
MRASSAFLVVVGTLVVGAIAYEVVRSRPPIAEPVQSRRPLRDDEKSRLEGGFLWRSLRGARTLVELRADSMLEIEGGAHFLRDVGELKVFAEDGRPISLSADRGTLRQLSPERTDV